MGKLHLTIPRRDLFGSEMDRRGIELLPITVADALRYNTLGFPHSTHKDPFDRILVAQALEASPS